MTLSSAPVARSNVEYVLRNVCHPIPLGDAQLFRDGTDVMTKKLLSPIRLLSSQKRYHRGLRSTLLGGHGLGVGVESDADRRMPHQFLHDLEFGTCSPQQCGVRSAKRMPPNPLRDAQLFRDVTDVMTKKLLSPIRFLSSILGAGERPTLRCSIGRSAIPAAQGTDQMIVKRQGFL